MRAGGGAAVVRDTILIAGVAALVFQLLRVLVGDRYVVPSGSMQPGLYGSRTRGDVVFVDKLAAASGLRRYDTAVMLAPQDASVHLVKRVVALGDDPENCWLELRDGDLWLGPAEHALRRDVKEPRLARDLRATWIQWPMPSGAGLDGFLAAGIEPVAAAGAAPRLLLRDAGNAATVRELFGVAARRERADLGEDPLPAAWLWTTRAIDGSYLDVYGGRGREGEHTEVLDVGVDARVALAGVGALYCGVDLRPNAWTFCWDVDAGRLELWRDGVTVASRELAVDPPAAPPRGRGASSPDATTRVEYGFLDGRFFFVVDDRQDATWCVEPPAAVGWSDPETAPWSQPRTRLCLGASLRAEVGAAVSFAAISSLQVFRDAHWVRLPALGPTRQATAVHVPSGSVYLLGDNAFDSRDSRVFGAVPLVNFVGRPRLILGPWPRWRRLPR